MREFELKRILFDADIIAQITILDSGVHVLIAGGECSHVGAVALARNGTLIGCLSFEGHREQVICERWAKTLSDLTSGCAAVDCGIHYDNATAEQIEAILQICDDFLSETLTVLKREDSVSIQPSTKLSRQIKQP